MLHIGNSGICHVALSSGSIESIAGSTASANSLVITDSGIAE